MSQNAAMAANGDKNYIVGIGASAGGLEALQKLLTALPSDTGFPFVIVQHLSPDYKSLLGEILGKHTEMPVIQVEDGMEVQPNCVYVIQPGKNMRIAGGRLHLTAQRERELNLPIDMFFRSLAEEAGSRAIAIILSGTGSDGTNGIKDIKERDGMIIVQDIESSKFDGMPRSAMRTGLVDAQLSPAAIAMELQHIASAARKEPGSYRPDREIDQNLMKRIYVVLKKVCNINFTHYKQTTVLRRIERRMMLCHMDTLAGYVDYLYENQEEVRALSREVLIGVTSFFRDPEYFQCLKDKAITDILLHSTAEDPIRVWVPGCSTGEEAYSIAILFCEEMDALKLRRDIKIFATDLDADAINTASKGVFGDNIIDGVTPARLSRFFSRKNNTYVVNRDIRKMIVFSPHNMCQDPPFGRLDLISCRNVLIYFQPVLQNDIFTIFHSALKNGGYLFLGKSEAIGAFTDAFPVVDAAAKIFTHRADVKIPGQKTIPYLQTTFLEDEISADDGGRYARSAMPAELPEGQSEAVETALLEQFMPACLVVNEKNAVVHIYGESGNYVHLPVGTFSNNLFDLITEALKVPVSTLLREAREKKSKVQYKDIAFMGEREEVLVNLTALPVNRVTGAETLYALVLSEKNQRGEMPAAVAYDIDKVASQRISDLEQELGDVQGKLDRSVAEQECVNEELQAANEELLTANEELQSSNEELQSVNEELYTVNSEYQQKLSELADLNDDIANFLSSTLTGIIFVDNKLNIRRYTDYVTTEFSVMDHDIGRSLKFISYHFPTVDIIEICENVLKTLVPDEREISTSKNKAFFMRVAPYRSTENKILGCVITLVDITTQKQGQVQLASTEKKLSLAQDAMEARTDYLARVTRELRGPIAQMEDAAGAVRGLAGDNPAMAAQLGLIGQGVERLTALVGDISEAARIERDSLEQATKPFSLRDAVAEAKALVETREEGEAVTVDVQMAEGFSPWYVGQGPSMVHILTSYLTAAAAHGGRVSLRAREDKARKANGEQVGLCIEIEGERIEGADTDLSLAVAENLVKSLGGAVEARPGPEGGTVWQLTMPMEPFAGEDGLRRSLRGRAALRNSRVLVAEDNPINRLILCSLLKKEGAICTEATDGEEALQAYMDAPVGTYACILMDMRMPKLDGIRATAAIRESGRGDAGTVPIIGVSANGFAEDVRKAREAGINSYTAKPIDRDALLAVMASVMGAGE